MEERQALSQVRRLVVKVGTSSLTYPNGKLNLHQLERVVFNLADAVNGGREVVLVTSGAVGAGVGRLGLNGPPRTLPEKQAAAAVGQGMLMHLYSKCLAEYGLTGAQVLLTRADLADRQRFLNARHTLMTLLRLGVIPIVNENDTIAVDEIRVGDNDTLSALVTGLVDARLLLLLTDIDGLYNEDPRRSPQATKIDVVRQLTPQLDAMAGGAGSALGTGGMGTKIQAARIATAAGAAVVIASGSEPGVVRRVLDGETLGTLFLPQEHHWRTKQVWIAFGSEVNGRLWVDAGAAQAVTDQQRSLLPVGITKTEGKFSLGEVVAICNADGREIARGIVNYGYQELDLIKGKPSNEIESILGRKDYDEVVHRDNLTVLVK